jgi:hypothetical protein
MALKARAFQERFEKTRKLELQAVCERFLKKKKKSL